MYESDIWLADLWQSRVIDPFKMLEDAVGRTYFLLRCLYVLNWNIPFHPTRPYLVLPGLSLCGRAFKAERIFLVICIVDSIFEKPQYQAIALLKVSGSLERSYATYSLLTLSHQCPMDIGFSVYPNILSHVSLSQRLSRHLLLSPLIAGLKQSYRRIVSTIKSSHNRK